MIIQLEYSWDQLVENDDYKTLRQYLKQIPYQHYTMAFVTLPTGLAAIQAVMNLLKFGDHVIATENLYGGSYRLFETIIKNYGVVFSWINTTKLNEIEEAIRPTTKMVFVETPTNPLLTISDIEGIAKICKLHKIFSVVDNTFMTPFFQNPLALGSYF